MSLTAPDPDRPRCCNARSPATGKQPGDKGGEGIVTARLLPFGQLPAHDAVQHVAPDLGVEDRPGQHRRAHSLARPVEQRHMQVRRACGNARSSLYTC